MTLHPSELRGQADRLLEKAGDHKKLVLIHTVIALGGSVLITALNYLFSLQIAQTGGLSGLGLRSLLATVQSVLELVVMVALPFWEIGLLYTALKWRKGENAGMESLLQGFRRFGAVFAFRLLYGVVFLALGLVLIYVCSFLFAMTPFAKPLMEILEPVWTVTATPEQMEALLTPELIAAATKAMIPMLILFAVVFLPVAAVLFYRLRFARFAVMEGERAGRSLRESLRMTRKRTGQLLKLDLHFWWFYLLQALCLAVSYGDSILAFFGIKLPVSPDGSFFFFYVLGAALQALLLWQYQSRVLTTYCLAYDALRDPEQSVA